MYYLTIGFSSPTIPSACVINVRSIVAGICHIAHNIWISCAELPGAIICTKGTPSVACDCMMYYQYSVFVDFTSPNMHVCSQQHAQHMCRQTSVCQVEALTCCVARQRFPAIVKCIVQLTDSRCRTVAVEVTIICSTSSKLRTCLGALNRLCLQEHECTRAV